MYYLFIHNQDDLDSYLEDFNKVKENIRLGKTPVWSEMRSAKTNLFESVPYNVTQGIFLIIAAFFIAKINVNDILKVAVVLVTENVCGAISNYIFVRLKHVLRVRLCNRLKIPPTEENIAVMESLEYQSV